MQRIGEIYEGLNLEPAIINPVPHFGEESGVLVLVFEIDEDVKTDREEFVITAKAKDQTVFETLEPASIRVYPVADFARLKELIKATVQPESWEKGLAIHVEEKTLSLIIQQTEKAHQEIQELLSQLRNAQDLNVRIQCRVFELTSEEDSKWLKEQVSLHALQNGTRWALLSQQRSETFELSLRERKPSLLSAPQVMTISDQAATIQIGSIVPGEKTAAGIRLEMTPHLIPDSKVIRMQHSFAIGDFANEMPQPVESLVGSGQTLLLLVDDPADKEKPSAGSQYLLMMTPEHILQIKKEDDVSVATPVDSAVAVDPTDSTQKQASVF